MIPHIVFLDGVASFPDYNSFSFGYTDFVTFFKQAFENVFVKTLNFVTSNWILFAPILIAFVLAVIGFIWSRFR